jgi:hypothetical protein
MDFKELPPENYKLRSLILSESIPNVTKATENYIENYNKANKPRLDEYIFFAANLPMLTSCETHFFPLIDFPYVEASIELDKALSLIYTGFYKHSHMAMRCALELVIYAVYFSQKMYKSDSKFTLNNYHNFSNQVSSIKKKGQNWLKSEKDTPVFSDMLGNIFHLKSLWEKVDKGFYWKKKISDHFGTLSDSVHTKGFKKSNLGQGGGKYCVCGISPQVFNEASCEKAIKAYVETVRHVVQIMYVFTIYHDFDNFEYSQELANFNFEDNEYLNLMHPDFKKHLNDLLEK